MPVEVAGILTMMLGASVEKYSAWSARAVALLPADLALGGRGPVGGDLRHPGGPAWQVVLDAGDGDDRVAGGADRAPGDGLRQLARVGGVVPQDRGLR